MSLRHRPLFALVALLMLAAVPGAPQNLAARTRGQAAPDDQARAILTDTAYTFPAPALAQDAPIGPAATVASEGFEGSWPGAGWVLNTGAYTVGKRTCHPRSGAYAGWLVGGGSSGSALGCDGQYPNNISTSARYGPIDLRGAQSASVRFYIWGRTEYAQGCAFDKVVALSSRDGVNYRGLTSCGDFMNGTAGNGYHEVTLDLSSELGQPQVWLLLGFISDGSNTDIGITVDDIVLDITRGSASTSPISGTVRDQVGAPVSDVTVIALPFAPIAPVSAQTLPDGTYTLAVPDGTYNLIASKLGYTSAQVVGVTVPPARTGVDIRLVPLGEPTVTTTVTTTPVTPTPTTPVPREQVVEPVAYLPAAMRGSAATPTPVTPTPGVPPGEFAIDGSWSGTTSQQAPIGFSITGRELASIAIGACGSVYRASYFIGRPKIVGNSFSIEMEGFNVRVSGTFASDRQASGAFEVSNAFCQASGTWSATKQ